MQSFYVLDSDAARNLLVGHCCRAKHTSGIDNLALVAGNGVVYKGNIVGFSSPDKCTPLGKVRSKFEKLGARSASNQNRFRFEKVEMASKMKVEELRAQLHQRGLATTGTKPTLVPPSLLLFFSLPFHNHDLAPLKCVIYFREYVV